MNSATSRAGWDCCANARLQPWRCGRVLLVVRRIAGAVRAGVPVDGPALHSPVSENRVAGTAVLSVRNAQGTDRRFCSGTHGPLSGTSVSSLSCLLLLLARVGDRPDGQSTARRTESFGVPGRSSGGSVLRSAPAHDPRLRMLLGDVGACDGDVVSAAGTCVRLVVWLRVSPPEVTWVLVLEPEALRVEGVFA